MFLAAESDLSPHLQVQIKQWETLFLSKWACRQCKTKCSHFTHIQKKLYTAMLMVKYVGAGLQDSLQEPMQHKTYVRPDSILQLQRLYLFTMPYSWPSLSLPGLIS